MRGISFIELLISLSLIIIFFVMALPFSTAFLARDNAKRVQQDISMAIRSGRNLAMLKGEQLALTPLRNNNWSSGMVLFVDNLNHEFDPSTGALQQWLWDYPNLLISWKEFRSDRFLLFSTHLMHATMSGHFTIQSNRSPPIILKVNRIGKITVNHLTGKSSS